MIIAFVIWSIVSILFMIIGISGWNSKKAVGFFTFVEPPAVKDIEKYNHAVSKIWFVVAILFEIIGIPLLFLEQNSPFTLLIVMAVVIILIVMMIAYLKVEAKYKA